MATVLVIDDNPQLRLLARKALEAEGHQVREAGDGDEGLRAYQEAPADVVLCDIFMPGRDGLEVIQRLRHRSPGARVVAMSGGSHLFSGDYLHFTTHLGAA